MKIYSDGKSRVLNGAFPKHFRLLNGEKEVPFIRTGRESIRISGELPVGDLLVDEIIRQKVAQPAKLDAQSLAIINKQDFDRIDILNKKLAINQEKMGEQMNALAEHEATLANLETKNAGDIELLSGQTASAVQMLKVAIEDTEKKNVAVQKALSQAIKETSEDLSDSLVAHETAKNPHRITKATIGLEKVENIKPEDMPVSKATKKELDKKADKKDIAEVEKKLTEKSDKIVKGIERMNMLGGVGGNELPVGGKKGYVLAKASNKTGDYEWKAGGGGVSIHNDLDGRNADNAHPMSAITGLGDALDSKYDASNPNNYQTGTQVANSIATETTNRENADNGLQSQIDAITASSDVKDIVGTYAELEAYDTSTLGNNDIIKVLQDETHSDETTYYRWSTATETFTLIGEEGPYYTKSEANSTFVPQTRTVNNKALSANITLTASDVGALPSSTTIGDGTLTIQKNGTAVQTFTANQTGSVTANITVPTDTGDLTNGAGYITGITSLMVTTALGYTPQPSGNYVTTDTAQDITATKTFTEPVTIQNGNGTGCLLVGANVNSSTLSNNQRKLARINAPSYANKDLGATLIGWDTSGDSDSPVTNKAYDSVCFGGMKKITNATSPMSITFCVTDTREATAAANKVYALAMDSNSAIFGVQPKYNGNNIATVNQIPTTAAQVGALPDTTKYGADLSYSSNTLQLLDQDGNNLGNSVSLPDPSLKANIDLDNLSTAGKNIANWSSNVSNCITNIPQDIKLELDSGILTLKAGSKVYVPNGFESDGTTPKFDVVTISSDVAPSGTWNGPAEVCLIYRADSNELSFADVVRFSSGSTAPTETNVRYWYDTTNNVIKRYQYGSMTSDKWSFPLALLYKESSSADTIIKSIDQVFNGFGYIGSTIFALPGVKGLIPNGRNADGTLNSTAFEIDSVKIHTYSGNRNSTIVYRTIDGLSAYNDTLYDEEKNITRESSGAVQNCCHCGKVVYSSGVITYFDVKTVFHSTDWNDAEKMMDGAFLALNKTIVTDADISGTGSYEYTLSDLPNDGHNYMALITANALSGSTSGNTSVASIKSSLLSNVANIARGQTRTSSSITGVGACWIPIGSDRKIQLVKGSNWIGTVSLYIRGYRRIGDND